MAGQSEMMINAFNRHFEEEKKIKVLDEKNETVGGLSTAMKTLCHLAKNQDEEAHIKQT